jgi:hypothetical protein
LKPWREREKYLGEVVRPPASSKGWPCSTSQRRPTTKNPKLKKAFKRNKAPTESVKYDF